MNTIKIADAAPMPDSFDRSPSRTDRIGMSDVPSAFTAPRFASGSAVACAAAAEYRPRYVGSRDGVAPLAREQDATHTVRTRVMPNHSLKLTRYGMHCLAAPGQVCYFPSAAKQRIPTRSA